ncbi:translocase [uncultured Pelagimonas sp.]|uniref:translocase n=1 Tax=uncultured Pelagimonas sp. TaxID=1618102 RepID=UPI00261254E3|nr:translocase [uncultured Pelagimonas sp.]
MARLKSYLLAGTTLVCALGIGYVMQFGLALPGQGKSAQVGPLEVSDITEVSSATAIPIPPTDLQFDIEMPGQSVELAAADAGLTGTELPQENSAESFGCDVRMEASPAAGAMVNLSLSSACHASERVTIHHQGMVFTEVMQPDGSLDVSVPALAEAAVFMASFASGDGAMATADVTSMPFYDRVVLQWKGDAGLQLHAREFNADYFGDGHVWASTAGDLTAAARGEGGFLTRLGQSDSPEALLAEIYSYPSGTTKRSGDIALSVEAEVTGANCETRVEAQTFEMTAGSDLRVRDMTLEIPGCDSTGDFLVLNNLVQDLTIAAR